MLEQLKIRLNQGDDITDLVAVEISKQIQCTNDGILNKGEYLYRLIKWSLDNPSKIPETDLEILIKMFKTHVSTYDWRLSDVNTRVFTKKLQSKSYNNDEIQVKFGKRLNTGILTYDNFFFEGYCLYKAGDSNWRNVMSIGAKLFRPMARQKMYSNHAMRGLQYIASNDDIEIAKKDNVKLQDEVACFVPESCQREEGQKIQLIAVDEKYFDRFKEYILNKNRLNGFTLHLHLMNPRPDQIALVKDMQEKGEKVGLSYEEYSCNDLKAYFIARRFTLALKLLKLYKGLRILLITDADIVIDKNKISNLLAEFEKSYSYIACKFHKANFPWTSIGAGILIFKQQTTEEKRKVMEFFENFSYLYGSMFEPSRTPYMNTQWYIDQGILISLVDYFKISPFLLNSYESVVFAFPKGNTGKLKEKELEIISKKIQQC